jgi:ubiquinone/menaquinone biosynthesis C-methylase UbiE
MTNNSNVLNQVEAFWDEKYSSPDISSIDVDSLILSGISPYGRKLFESILGNFEGKEVLDLGCGDGALAVYMAKRGAKVTAIDISKNSITNTVNLAKLHNVEDLVTSYQANALEIDKFGKKFDLIVGKFILHHIEPFGQFSQTLKKSLKQGGRGLFVENSSRSPILRFARRYIIGKFGIPKYGDSEEYPFEPREIDLLKEHVGSVRIQYPDFVFFRILNSYVFKHSKKFSLILSFLVWLDDFIYFYLPFLRKYSYTQIVEVSTKN